MESEILTESGTNEAEFLEFYLNNQGFAINVSKVVQIIPFDEERLTRLAGGSESLLGSLLWRDKTIDLIDLYKALNTEEIDPGDQPVVLVTNFNKITCGFKTRGVNRIHRVGWDEIKPLDPVLERYSPMFTGSISINGKNILLVDFEKLIAGMFQGEDEKNLQALLENDGIRDRRSMMNVVLAEDSNSIRKNVIRYLKAAGYTVNAHENGQLAWDYLNRTQQEIGNGNPVSDIVNLVITDIEMPQMDGLTFCRKIKETDGFTGIPVVIFSSLINEQMALKCQEVGADAYLTKPQADDLIDIIDDILLK